MIKIDENFYKEDNNYNKDIYDGYEQDIKKYINKYKKEEYEEIIKQDKRTNIVTSFSEMRANIIKWYNFDKDKKVLEIGANYGEITQELVKKCKEVTAIEFCKEKAECISKRLEDISNLKLILCTKLKELKLGEKYDYILLIGIVEYANKIGFKGLEEMLKWTSQYLEDDGKILLAIDNKFGVKYLAGSTRNKGEISFANYKTYIKKDYELYGKNELENIIKNSGFENYKFYYPVPNYKLTHLIYTDNYLPKQNSYNIYYREDEEILYNELTLIDDVIKNNKFDFFTNSFLVELSLKKENLSDVYFVNYSNMRKKEYKIITKIEENQVTKEAYRQEGMEHIKQIEQNINKLENLEFNICEKVENNKIISPYILKPTMDEYLRNILMHEDSEKFINELEKWYDCIKNKIEHTKDKNNIFSKYNIEITDEQQEKLTFLKDGFIDLIFQNVFYDGNEYILFDQEWYEENVPLEFIMYRSIKQLFFQHNELEKITNKEEIYERYNIIGYIEIFEKLEEQWQKSMVDEEIFKFYSEKWSRIISIEDIKFRYNQELGKLYAERDELQEEINRINGEKIKIEQELADIKNGSRFYRLIKFFKQERGKK